MFKWSRAPISLRAYVVLNVGWVSVDAALTSRYVAFGLFGAGLTVVVAFFLLKGVRWLWLGTTGLHVFYVLTAPFLGVPWYSIALGVVTVVLLVVPDTRRFFARDTDLEEPSASASL